MNVRVITGAGFEEFYKYIYELTQTEKIEDNLSTYIRMHMHFNDIGSKGTVLTPESELFNIQKEYLNKIIKLAPHFFHMSWNGPAETMVPQRGFGSL